MVRFKHRYLLCEVVAEDPRYRHCIHERAVTAAAKGALARAHGDYGLACCSIAFTVKYLNAYTGVVLLRCRKDFYRLLWSALPLVTHLESRGQRHPCFFHTLHVGGTIRSCQKFLIQYNRRQLVMLLNSCTNKEERESIQKSLLGCSLQEVEEEQFQSAEEEDDCAETD
ncbi:PREDICTED: ribonuclease P/MRP protein subunit POP5 [Crocodylus porosus]|uniref:Ribonuclease P/MRP protein subunit POP5 n=1 Tax=Crocodylus porosus TaxID=8502 RepID=A0A7M4EB37_CROPO|nr:PREDICTED: ribonuclease P/MRP protein subunit POP5 [Crocodylus porosus]